MQENIQKIKLQLELQIYNALEQYLANNNLYYATLLFTKAKGLYHALFLIDENVLPLKTYIWNTAIKHNHDFDIIQFLKDMDNASDYIWSLDDKEK